MRGKVHGLRFAPVLAGVVCAGMSVSSVSAQVAVPDATRPAAAPAAGNNWWDAPPQQAAATRQPEAPSTVFRHDPVSPYASNITDYPSGQMTDWVMASAMAARSRVMLTRAQSELNLSIRRVQQRFEHSDEFIKAAIAEKQTYTAYIAARQQVLSGLFNDPKYHAIMQLHDELNEKINSRRTAHADATSIDLWLGAHGFDRTKLSGEQMITLKVMYEADMQKASNDDTSKEDILALATLKMQYASDARAIEVAALGADDNLKAAREKMVEASRYLAYMRAQFDYALHDNPEVLIARRNLEDARIAVVEAQALACSAGIASSYALNYSYYLHRNDNSGLNGPYGAGGYTTPYWGR